MVLENDRYREPIPGTTNRCDTSDAPSRGHVGWRLRGGQLRRRRRGPPAARRLGQPTEPLKLTGVGPTDAPTSVSRQPAMANPPPLEPSVQGGLPDPQPLRQVNREPFVPAQRRPFHAPQRTSRRPPSQ